jgi:hypothetical protein
MDFHFTFLEDTHLEDRIEITMTLSRGAIELLEAVGMHYVAAGLAADMPVEYNDKIANELASEIGVATASVSLEPHRP